MGGSANEVREEAGHICFYSPDNGKPLEGSEQGVARAAFERPLGLPWLGSQSPEAEAEQGDQLVPTGGRQA